MAIGILGAIDKLQGKDRPDDDSVLSDIDILASLPQALIMQMAQKGQIPKDKVLPIMNKKNDNAQAAAQIKAVAQQMAQQQQMGDPPPSTVFEKVMAQNAAQEAAPVMDRSNVGVASAPMRPDMFAKAGGGIVAFGNGGLLEEYSKLPRFEYTDPVFEGQPLSKLFRRFKRPEGISSLLGRERRVTPDGKVVSFGEFMRMAEQQDADIADDFRIGQMAPEPSGFEGAVDESEGLPSGMPIEKYDEKANRREDIPGRRQGDGLRKITDMKDMVATDAEGGEDFDREEAIQKSDIQNIANRADDAGGLDTNLGEIAPSRIRQLFNLPERKTDAEGKPLSLADRAKQILTEQEAVLGERPIYKKGKLSGEDLAMLGLELGLGMLGTKEQDFLTAAGQAGQPVLKTALAKQKEMGERQLKESLAKRAEKSAVLSDIQKEDRQVRAEERKFAKDIQLEGMKKEADFILTKLRTDAQLTAADIQSTPKITRLAKEIFKKELANEDITLEEAIKETAKKDYLQKEASARSGLYGFAKQALASADGDFKLFAQGQQGRILYQATAGNENAIERLKTLGLKLKNGAVVDSPNKAKQFLQEERDRIEQRTFDKFKINRSTIAASRFQNNTIPFNKLLENKR